jgi:hypothetical protein
VSIPFVRLDAVPCLNCAMPILLKARPVTPQTVPCPNCHAKVEVHVVVAGDGSRAVMRWRRPADPAWQERQISQ